MESIWQKNSEKPQFEMLNKNIRTDVLIIGGGWNELRKFAKKYYPNASVVCQYATQDCKTLDDIPYIGQYSKKPHLFM